MVAEQHSGQNVLDGAVFALHATLRAAVCQATRYGFSEGVLWSEAGTRDHGSGGSVWGPDRRAAAERAAALFDVRVEDTLQPGKSRLRSQARSVFCYWAVRELEHTTSSIALNPGLTEPAISKAIACGELLVKERDLHLENRKL